MSENSYPETYLQRPQRLTRQQMVIEFMNRKERIGWFSTPSNSMFAKRVQIGEYLNHWANTGEWGPDYDDKELVVARSTMEKTIEELYLTPAQAKSVEHILTERSTSMNEKQKAYMNYLEEFSKIDSTTFCVPGKTAKDFGLTDEEALSAFREERRRRLDAIGIIVKEDTSFPDCFLEENKK